MDRFPGRSRDGHLRLAIHHLQPPAELARRVEPPRGKALPRRQLVQGRQRADEQALPRLALPPELPGERPARLHPRGGGGAERREPELPHGRPGLSIRVENRAQRIRHPRGGRHGPWPSDRLLRHHRSPAGFGRLRGFPCQGLLGILDDVKEGGMAQLRDERDHWCMSKTTSSYM